MKSLQQMNNNQFNLFFNKKEQSEQSHFEDIESTDVCISPSHNPPQFLYIPQGKQYVHICPNCGSRAILRPPQIRL